MDFLFSHLDFFVENLDVQGSDKSGWFYQDVTEKYIKVHTRSSLHNSNV